MRVTSKARVWAPGLAAICLVLLMNIGSAAAQQPSINSTSRNRTTLPAAPVEVQPLANLKNFRILAANDLGMHCGDLDHRIASILPPFNVIHAQVFQTATALGALPRILTDVQTSVVYSSSFNPKDPALQRVPTAPIYKTNFWNNNPATGNPLGFDAYNPFYPPNILINFPLNPDVGLPVPDVARLYLGDGTLVAFQQAMPSVTTLSPFAGNPYVRNKPQVFTRFDADVPFFINFPFGYTLTARNWFAADGIPAAPFDDFGRLNAFPLMRIQAKDKTGLLTGIPNRTLSSVDTVVPVAAEADCFRCHTSAVDGGNGQAACLPGIDLNCPRPGSPTNRSGLPFTVSRAAQDRASVPLEVSREWAADQNILRLHDAKHRTGLINSKPVVCQRCHYTPALDLAHLGPLGPGDAAANGREQKNHSTNSRVLHTFHGKLDLFQAKMPPPNGNLRVNPATGKPVVNILVQNTLNNTCYQCHPGRDTKCLRGVMFGSGGLVCQDCHGNMLQVGDDFSAAFPTTPFPAGLDLTKRIPWANEPACQSCHTGDVLTTIAGTDPAVIRAPDGIRLMQAYRKGNAAATPITAPTSRFAENQSPAGIILYRLSKDSHAGIFCEGCHGSTHAEWPVKPEAGTVIANDNRTPIERQGHSGKIMECTVCHAQGTIPVSLDGPHGLHAVNDLRWVRGHEGFLDTHPLNSCRACHGRTGLGTVLAKVSAPRALALSATRTVTLTKGQLVACNICHANPLR